MINVLADNQITLSDKQLVLRCKQGDLSCFRQIYSRYQPRVRSTLYQLCGGQILDDLVQEVFLRIWKGLPKLRQNDYFSTWVYRITWNVATDQRRELAKHQKDRELEFYRELSSFAGETLPHDSHLMKLHYQDLVTKALLTLTLEHRAVLVLHDLEDVSQKEISNILDIPLGTVKSRLFYARNAIKKYLEQQGISL